MENEYEKLIDIRLKMSIGEPLTDKEQYLWHEWISRSYVKDFQYYDEELFEEMLIISLSEDPYEGFWKELERQSRKRPKPKKPWNIGRVHALFMKSRNIAASLIIITGILLSAWYIFLRKEKHIQDEEFVIIKVPPRENKEVKLPDGSIVWLNAGSTLRYPSIFNTDKRIVELNGEAYFDVKHLNDNTPLYVLTNNQEIKVIGTKFNVDDYSNNKFKKTTLLEGSVIIKARSGTEQPSLLKPGERSVMVNSSEFTVERSPIPTQATAWKRDSFYFEDTPLTEIMNKLENWYEVKIVFDEGVIDKKYTLGAIARKQPLTWVLQVLEATGGFKFKRGSINIKKGDTIRISKNDSNVRKYER